MGNGKLTKILTKLFNKIRETCKILLDWKFSDIILITKKKKKKYLP